MEHATLRLILLICGILLIAGIYFFDYMSRKKDKIAEDNRQEPLISNDIEVPSKANKAPESAPVNLPHLPSNEEINNILLTEEDLSEAGLSEMVLQIHVVSKNDEFQGLDIQAIAKKLKLVTATIGIYDRRMENTKDILYSMANLVKPGVFTFHQMHHFSTPGLALFGRLPSVQAGKIIYADMLDCAEKIASTLNGELQDASRSDLTHQTIEHTYAEIQEYERQIFLLKRRKII